MYGNYYGMSGYPNPYAQAVPDGLAQLRANQQPQPSVPGMIWVLGESEARSYPVAAGSTVVLWDRDTPTIFIKSADASGIPSLRVLEWKDKEKTAQEPQAGEYLTRKEFEEWAAKYAPQEVNNNG